MCGILFSLLPSGSLDNPLSPSGSHNSLSLSGSRNSLSLISRRGPDSTHTHTVASAGYILTFASSVLALRGEITPQPLVDPATGSVLCWNGEAWRIGEDALEPGVNDGKEVFKRLIGGEVQSVLAEIAGPYAFVYFDAASGRVWFGRDVLGRRSLLWRGERWEDGLVVASVGGGETWKEVEADGVRFLDLERGERGWVPFLWEGEGEFMKMPFPRLNTTVTAATGSITPGSPEVEELRRVLRESVDTRVRDIPGRGEDVRMAILFSGGLDCTVIARLVHDCLPVQEGVDLLNVAFENRRVIDARNTAESGKQSRKAEPANSINDPYELCPDRITGRKSLAELRRVCPDRDWRFVAINIPYEELLQHRQMVIDLIHPHNTEMDLSIAVAFYFASRGAGVLSAYPYTTPARILFSGLGADELLGGYARHSTAYRFRGTEGLLSELALDVGRLGKRNLGRDDRVLAHWGREARYPFLEERVVGWCMRAGWEGKRDKCLLRCLATLLGMSGVAGEAKRAVQFGSRSARMEGGEKGKVKGTKVLSDMG